MDVPEIDENECGWEPYDKGVDAVDQTQIKGDLKLTFLIVDLLFAGRDCPKIE